jgi:hypothetical protein
MRGDGQNQLKISAPHPMTETYRLIPLLAALISLDSPVPDERSRILEVGIVRRLLTWLLGIWSGEGMGKG